MKHLENLGNDIFKVTDIETNHSYLVKWDEYANGFIALSEVTNDETNKR